MNEYRIGKIIDSGWFDWDLCVYCGPGVVLKVATAQEEHGGEGAWSASATGLRFALAFRVDPGRPPDHGRGGPALGRDRGTWYSRAGRTALVEGQSNSVSSRRALRYPRRRDGNGAVP